MVVKLPPAFDPPTPLRKTSGASPVEILAAWLPVWIPPRDVEVPPLTRRAVVIVLDFRAGRYALGKTNSPPGEGASGCPEEIVELPRPCHR